MKVVCAFRLKLQGTGKLTNMKSSQITQKWPAWSCIEIDCNSILVQYSVYVPGVRTQLCSDKPLQCARGPVPVGIGYLQIGLFFSPGVVWENPLIRTISVPTNSLLSTHSINMSEVANRGLQYLSVYQNSLRSWLSTADNVPLSMVTHILLQMSKSVTMSLS